MSVQVYERKVHCLSNYNIEEPQPPWSIAAGYAAAPTCTQYTYIFFLQLATFISPPAMAKAQAAAGVAWGGL